MCSGHRLRLPVGIVLVAISGALLVPALFPVMGDRAMAASPNSNGNGNSDTNRGNGGRSASAGSGNSNSGPSSNNHGPGSDHSAPVNQFVSSTLESGDVYRTPGQIHFRLGSAHSRFNADKHALENAADESRPMRWEQYLQTTATTTAALEATGGGAPTDEDYAMALAYLEAHAILIAPLGEVTEQDQTDAQGVIDSSSLTDPAEAQAIVDAYETTASATSAFEEASNRPYDEASRSLIDDVATFLGIPF